MSERKRRKSPWTYMVGEHMFQEPYFPKTYMGRIAIDILCELEARTRTEIKDERWVFFSVPYYAWMYGVSHRTIQNAFRCLQDSDLARRVDEHNEARLWITSKGVRVIKNMPLTKVQKGEQPFTPGVNNHSPLEEPGVHNGSAGVHNHTAGVNHCSLKEDIVEDSLEDSPKKEDEVRRVLQKKEPSPPASPDGSEPVSFAKRVSASQSGAVAPEPPQTKKSVHEQVKERLDKIKATASDTEPEPPRRRGGRSNPPSSVHMTGPETLLFHLVLHPEDDPRDIKSQMDSLEAKIRGTESEAESEKLREEWRALGQKLQSILEQFGIKKLSTVETCS